VKVVIALLLNPLAWTACKLHETGWDGPVHRASSQKSRFLARTGRCFTARLFATHLRTSTEQALL